VFESALEIFICILWCSTSMNRRPNILHSQHQHHYDYKYARSIMLLGTILTNNYDSCYLHLDIYFSWFISMTMSDANASSSVFSSNSKRSWHTIGNSKLIVFQIDCGFSEGLLWIIYWWMLILVSFFDSFIQFWDNYLIFLFILVLIMIHDYSSNFH
jgi:hypothetical protein